jgi:hypothetical protein
MGVGSTVTSQKAELSVALVGVPLQNTVNSSIRTSTLHAFLGEDLSPAGASLTRVLRLLGYSRTEHMLGDPAVGSTETL